LARAGTPNDAELDDAGKIVKEVKVASEPQALLKVLGNPTYRFKRIGLEAGPLSQCCCKPSFGLERGWPT
jgi:hypothetical protein